MNSLAEELWDEWSVHPAEDPLQAEAECAGLLSGLASGRGRNPLQIGTSRLWAVHRLFRLWRRTPWAGRWNLADALAVPQNMKGRVCIRLPDDLPATLDSYGAELLEATSPPPLYWSWLRGLWGGCGGLYVPRSGYYLVLRVSSPPAAAILKGLLPRTRIVWQRRLLHGTHEMILRDQQKIVTFLSKLGLTGISLRMEDMAIMRSMRDRANRIRNCDTANIKRTLKVAEEQTALALRIQDTGLVDRLPPALRQLVEARLENPEASLAELGEGLSPPITKSTVKYRWQRLSGYAETLTARQDGIEAEDKEKGTGGVEGETENVRS